MFWHFLKKKKGFMASKGIWGVNEEKLITDETIFYNLCCP